MTDFVTPSGTQRFETESGSLYELDHDARTWRRLRHADDSTAVRTPDGSFTQASPVIVGRSVHIVGAPLDPAADLRLITTSPVTRIVPVPGESA